MADWFAPKRYGYGAGLPIAWQGWVLTIAFVILILLASLLIHVSMLAYFSTILTLVLAFTIIAARTTRGGWRWRWGNGD